MRILPALAAAAVLTLSALAPLTTPAQAASAQAASAQAVAPGHGLLVADANQDGRLTRSEAGRAGAVFIPNLDDDGPACGPIDKQSITKIEDVQRAEGCSDASDNRVDGPADLADMAPVRLLPQPGVAPGTTARIRVEGPAAAQTRVFLRRHGQWVVATKQTLTTDELRRGVHLAVEGTGLITAPGADQVTISITRSDHTADSVQLRLAPVRFTHDLQPVERLLHAKPFVSDPKIARKLPTSIGDVDLPTLPDPKGKSEAAKKKRSRNYSIETARYERDFHSSLRSATTGVPTTQIKAVMSRWTQDQFEAGSVSMAARGGGVHTMRVLVRPPYGELMPLVSAPDIRAALGRDGVGIAGIFKADHGPRTVDPSLNAGGNIEALPPTPDRPDGSLLIGAVGSDRTPDRAWLQMLAAQAPSPLVKVDTTWLDVGHVDEFLHVVRDDNAQGWTFAVADPRGTIELLRTAQAEGHGQTIIRSTTGGRNRTIDDLLSDQMFLRGNERAAALIDTQIASLTRQLGTRPEELVRLPALFKDAAKKGDKGRRMVALTPAVVNGLSLSPEKYVAAEPHGPVIGGVDLFARATEHALAAQGISVSFVEDRGHLHNLGGEVHCGTNALRRISP